MKTYNTGFVVGKFCPLTKGHEYLIKTAMARCNRAVVLSYTSKTFPKCTDENRRKWTESLNENNQLRVVVLDASNVPDDDADDETHREFCANYLLNKLDTTVQAVFSSETYGIGLAEHLSDFFTESLGAPVTVDHVMVDLERKHYPISGTEMRAALATGYCPDMMKYLSPVVFASFVYKILFLGGESTGKSTL